MKKTIANMSILLILLNCFGCGQPIDEERTLEVREIVKYGGEEEEISVLYIDASTEITHQYQTTTSCEILGYLNDYTRLLTIDNGDDLVEQFYSSEKEEAESFYELLKQFVAEAKLDIEIQKNIDEGGHIIFRSKELAQILNSFYTKTEDDAFYSLDISIFNNPYPEYKLAFLRGAHARYGVKGRNMFHFAYQDQDVIIDLLDAVHCENIRYIQEVGWLPSCTTIIFRPTDAVKEHLGITTLVNIFLEDTNPNDTGLANTSSVWRFEKNQE